MNDLHPLVALSRDIAASPETVWSILTDLEAYADWNPFITQASGEVTVGTRLVSRIADFLQQRRARRKLIHRSPKKQTPRHGPSKKKPRQFPPSSSSIPFPPCIGEFFRFQ